MPETVSVRKSEPLKNHRFATEDCQFGKKHERKLRCAAPFYLLIA
jgi:hypothetical protein